MLLNNLYRKLIFITFRLKRLFFLFHLSLIGGVTWKPDTKISHLSFFELHNKDSKNSIKLGSKVVIKDFAYLCPRGGFIHIDDYSSINMFCVLLGYGGIKIGKGVRIANSVKLIAFNHNYEDKNKLIYNQKINCKGIVIEDDVWIGASSVILDGVTLAKGKVVGANSTVTKSTKEYEVVVGSPAKSIKKRK